MVEEEEEDSQGHEEEEEWHQNATLQCGNAPIRWGCVCVHLCMLTCVCVLTLSFIHHSILTWLCMLPQIKGA
jgi:hypothetical protein